MQSYYKLVFTLSFVFDDCLAQFSSKYVLQEEQHQVVFGLRRQNSSHRFGEKFNLPVVRSSETQTEKNNVVLGQVEAMREAGISAIELPCLQRNHEVMWTFVQKPLSLCSLRESWF